MQTIRSTQKLCNRWRNQLQLTSTERNFDASATFIHSASSSTDYVGKYGAYLVVNFCEFLIKYDVLKIENGRRIEKSAENLMNSLRFTKCFCVRWIATNFKRKCLQFFFKFSAISLLVSSTISQSVILSEIDFSCICAMRFHWN